MALPRKFRLSDDSEIKNVLKYGSSFNSESFLVKFSPADAGTGRLAIIIGTKVSKKASVRNRIKRKLSEVIRLNLSKISPDHLVVIVAKSGLAGKKPDDFGRELLDNLKRINRFK